MFLERMYLGALGLAFVTHLAVAGMRAERGVASGRGAYQSNSSWFLHLFSPCYMNFI